MEDTTKILVYNLLMDLRKKEFDPLQRATIIRAYLESEGISIRQLGERTGISHSTLEDWLLWEKIDEAQVEQELQNGFTHKDIYRSLRAGTLSGKKVAIDLTLANCISKLEIFKIRPPHSRDTKILIAQLEKILNVIKRQV